MRAMPANDLGHCSVFPSVSKTATESRFVYSFIILIVTHVLFLSSVVHTAHVYA